MTKDPTPKLDAQRALPRKKLFVADDKAEPAKRGRPAGKGEKPWVAEGISRQAWYKRKAKGDGK